ncbi:hypothetical protein SEUCBS139899_009051 [Sporothrix eucalyptigena]|uniref:CFEM domain-containing protein n=1 Tax=Sporothrix eucalyptigena TaxID=1812306 RepID=A0ABP0CG19_9PEZI
MKSAIFALALAGSAVAQNLSGEPQCASSCLISAISAAGCAADDVGCQCGPTQSAIATLVAPCLLASCAGSALIQAESAGLALCSIYSKTAGSPASTTATATGTATTTGSAAGTSTAVTTVTKSSSGTLATVTTSSKTSTRAAGNTTVTTGTKTTTKGGASGTGATTSTSTAGAATLGAGVLAAFVGLIAAL